MKTQQWVIGGLIGLAMIGTAYGTPTSLSNVPAYNWYHGCGPTAAASIMGYYDVHGYTNLFDASGWDAVKLTGNVQDQISSPAHNAKYDPNPDVPDSILPVPPKTSIADWFKTSVNQGYGWSWLSDAWGPNGAFGGYATYRGYHCATDWRTSTSSTGWTDFVAEINAGRPVMFLVDSDGDGGTAHFVPAFGFEDRGANGKWYECYTTWTEDETPAWYQYRAMSSSYPWGVAYETFVRFDPAPEPSTLALLATAAVALLAVVRQRYRR
jgi:hypothetical protein